MNLKTKNQYHRIKRLTKLKSFESIERLINRSVGYFNKIVSDKKRINKGHIQSYFFILEDILESQKREIPPIEYGTKNQTIIEYAELILKMRCEDHYSFTMIVNELRTKYKKRVSRSLIYNFIKLNEDEWNKYYG